MKHMPRRLLMDALKDQTLIASQLSKLRLGETQQFKNITVIPLFSSVNHSPEYLTLKEALEKNLTTITEVGLGGSVPELKVTNLADLPVLLVDGEELIGAKQNRILNTTILLREKSVTVIPVTCTESGRWHHTTHQFSHSDHIMSAKIRKLKSSHVTTSLKHALGYMADQGAIWGEVHVMASHAKVQSPTHALHEVFKAKTPQMNDYVTAFKPVPGQNGLLVFVNGVVVGLDVVSLERAYQVVHPSLIKSYAIDAVLAPTDKSSEQAAEKATAFLGEAAACKER